MAESLPIAALLLLLVGLAVQGEALLRYTDAAAQGLSEPAHYIDAVMRTRPLPQPALPAS